MAVSVRHSADDDVFAAWFGMHTAPAGPEWTAADPIPLAVVGVAVSKEEATSPGNVAGEEGAMNEVVDGKEESKADTDGTTMSSPDADEDFVVENWSDDEYEWNNEAEYECPCFECAGTWDGAFDWHFESELDEQIYDIEEDFYGNYPLRSYGRQWRRASKKNRRNQGKGAERRRRRVTVVSFTAEPVQDPVGEKKRKCILRHCERGNKTASVSTAVSATPLAPRTRTVPRAVPINPEQQNFERAVQASLADAVATRSTYDTSIGLTWRQIRALQERELTPEDYELLLVLAESVEKKTVAAEDLERIAQFIVRAEDLTAGGRFLDVDEEVMSCCICMTDFEVADAVKILPCEHAFHAACIDQWLSNSVTCPLDGMSLEGRL